ncbi:Tex-like N-terminal domain-containing protein [Thomasclavelia cocleata]|uniref:Tex-like N-terminal domain-containing protein n=1 Tax=Thomasclavelia cocleata TaxID=69824 RepID=UPI00272E0C65|nr:Tex family protein [Thomasclavelia cocleata]
MNEDIIKIAVKELEITEKQINAVLALLEQGNTVPFIARYRKEATGGLDEDQIRNIDKYYQYQVNLLKRKEDVIRLIDEKGMLTDQLKSDILKATKLNEVEDLYRPYKEKRKTRATEAKAKGLEPLSKWILSLPKGDINQEAGKYLNDKLESIEDVIQGALDIIAEVISDDIKYRKFVKDIIYKSGIIETKVKKKNPDEAKVYEMYYDYHERVNRIVSHRILAINRAENEKVIAVNIVVDKDFLTQYINRGVTKNRNSSVNEHLFKAVEDSLNRLLLPSIEREVRSELTEKASEQALKVFSINLEKLLMQAPLKDKMVLGLDPAYRTGCKLAVVDQTGKVLKIDKVFITIPKANYDKEKKVLLDIIKKYNIEIIAIGNGTASRESEAFISQLIKDNNLNVDYAIISEAGASVYSASKLAKEEFPDYQVEERSAVSIARRLQDPLAELVKIEPKAISVGQYQHDIAQKQLEEQLDFVVEKAVNNVGVDINTASVSLLQYVAGLNAGVAKNIIKYRDENGKFTNRKEIMNVSKLGAKTYQQAIGFLRIPGANDPFDATAIHPENYQQAKKLLELIGANESALGTKEIAEKLGNLK